MDAGIIRAFKAHYRRLYIRHVLERDEAGEQNIWHIDQLAAMRIAEEAWGIINASTIINCWRHSGILSPRDGDGKPLPAHTIPDAHSDNPAPVSVQKSIELLQEAINKLAGQRVGTASVMKATEMVDVDAEKTTERALTDNEIMEQARAELDPVLAENNVEDDDVEPVLPPVKALQAVKEHQRFALTQSGKEWDEAMRLLPQLTRSLQYSCQEILAQSTLNEFFACV
jgi:hypothetical protein